MKKHSQIVKLNNAQTREAEAAYWLAKLDGGQLSEDDRAQFRYWIGSSPENAEAIKKLAAFWEDMGFLLNEFPASHSTKKSPYLTNWRQAAVAACIALLLVSTLMLTDIIKIDVSAQKSFYVTTIGNQRKQNLSDGSVAHLNTDSMLEVEYSENQRTVRLLKGEALFDVAHDKDRPFIVLAGDNQVVALGTRFVVKLNSENVSVTVTDGKVKLSKRTTDQKTVETSKQEAILLLKGEEVTVKSGNPIPPPQAVEPIQANEIERKISWTKGRLIFEDEPLGDVISEIGRYLPEKVIIEDSALRDIRVSGRFIIGDAEALLEAVEVSLNVKIDRLAGDTIRISME